MSHDRLRTWTRIALEVLGYGAAATLVLIPPAAPVQQATSPRIELSNVFDSGWSPYPDSPGRERTTVYVNGSMWVSGGPAVTSASGMYGAGLNPI